MGTRLMPYLDNGSLASVGERFSQGSTHLHDTVLFLVDWETRVRAAMLRNLPESMPETERERAAAAMKTAVSEAREAVAAAVHKMNGLSTIAELVIQNAKVRDVRTGA